MTCPSLMVYLELGRPNTRLLRLVGELAQRFDAGVIGIAACQPMPVLYEEGLVAGDLLEQDRERIRRQMSDTQAEFRAALHQRARSLEWRCAVLVSSLADYVAREARCADLLISGMPSGHTFDVSRGLNRGGLVLQCGCPVLFVPDALDSLPLRHAMVAWNDSRESRRALRDALPLLKRTGQVAVVELAVAERQEAARTHLEDVVGWLRRHGVAAQSLSPLAVGAHADQIARLARERDVDLVVAGAYGHSRLREWALGGVTRHLLHSADRCTLLSH